MATATYRNAGIAATIGLACGFVYWRYSRRARHPIADLTLLKVRSFSIALGGGMCTRLGTAGLSFVLMLFLQVGCGWTPTAAGLMVVPQAAAMVLMKPLITRILGRYGYRHTLFVNTTLATLLLAAFALLDAATPWWAIAALMFAYGFVMSLQYTSMNTLAFVDLAPERAAQASSLTSAVQYLVISFGIALSSWLLAVFLGGRHHDPAAYVQGFRVAVLVMAAMPLAGVYVFTRLRHDRPLRRPVETPETAT